MVFPASSGAAGVHGRGKQREGRATAHAVPLDLNACRVLAGGVLPDDCGTWTALTVPTTPSHVVRFSGVAGLNCEYAVGLKKFEVCSSTRDD